MSETRPEGYVKKDSGMYQNRRTEPTQGNPNQVNLHLQGEDDGEAQPIPDLSFNH